MKKSIQRIISLLLCVCMFAGMAITANAEETSFVATAVVSSDNKTVTVTISAGSEITTDGFQFNYDVPEGWSANVDLCSAVASFTVNNGTSYVAYGNDATTNDLVTITYTVPEGATGSFDLGVTNLMVSGDGGDIVYANGVSVTTNVSIGTTTPATGYTAALSPATTSVNNDSQSTVNVDVVVGGTAGKFASTEIKLTYDPVFLRFSSGIANLNPEVTGTQADQAAEYIVAKDDSGKDTGTLTIRDYGGTMTTNGTDAAYTVKFNTVKGGNTQVSLSSAGFSEQANAADSDLIPAEVDSKVDVTINHKANVTVDGTAGATTYVAPNGSYTYQINDYNATKYTYNVTATEGTGENANDVADSRISISNTGLVTISDVQGELAVTISKTANSYNITWKDEGNAITADKPTTQTYGTGITFSVAAGSKPADSTQSGYYYEVEAYLTDSDQTVTVTGTPTEDNYAAKTYTIAADAITGDITIEVTKVAVDATQTTITIDGDYTELKINNTTPSSATVTVSKNQEVTVTVTEADGYTYKVETVVGGAATELTKNDEGNYTFTPSDALTLKVTKTLNTTSLEVKQYVQLNGKTMWLVKINGLTNTQDKTYTYTAAEGGTAQNFYWSGTYSLSDSTTQGAYCFLIVTQTDENANEDSVKTNLSGKIGLTNSAATTISYNGNVNLTKNGNDAVIDMNDAQLVWNMYSAVYSDIDENVTVQKFLEADMNADGSLNTDDAAAVVGKLQ